MGQQFYGCAYDIEKKTCCVVNADKFHANCYSFSGAVRSIHYLLRQAPYRIMWVGDYVTMKENISKIIREEDLLGLSTIYDQYYFKNEDEDENYYKKASFIDENNKQWKKINVWDISEIYFDYENTKSVKYEGYLINHTKKLAVDLVNYYEKSKSYTKNHETFVVDLVPPLTETGGGIEILLLNGLSTQTTEEFASTWCGDLLQIVDKLPENYSLIDCCFLEAVSRYRFCYYNFGVNSEDLIMDNNGLFSAVTLSLRSRKRSYPCYIKAVIEDGYINFTSSD